jgi:hypothetical protein
MKYTKRCLNDSAHGANPSFQLFCLSSWMDELANVRSALTARVVCLPWTTVFTEKVRIEVRGLCDLANPARSVPCSSAWRSASYLGWWSSAGPSRSSAAPGNPDPETRTRPPRKLTLGVPRKINTK